MLSHMELWQRQAPVGMKGANRDPVHGFRVHALGMENTPPRSAYLLAYLPTYLLTHLHPHPPTYSLTHSLNDFLTD